MISVSQSRADWPVPGMTLLSKAGALVNISLAVESVRQLCWDAAPVPELPVAEFVPLPVVAVAVEVVPPAEGVSVARVPVPAVGVLPAEGVSVD